MGRGRSHDAIDALRLTRSQMEILIYEANLGSYDTLLAHCRWIERLANVDTAGELSDATGAEVDRKTVAIHIRDITPKLVETYNRIKDRL